MILRCRSAILCDDVRTEDNGKSFLIGTYGKVVLANQIPSLLQFIIAMTFDTDQDKTTVEIRVSTLTSNIIVNELVGTEGYAGLLIPLQVALTEPRTLTLEYRDPGAEWIVAGSWELRFSDNVVPAPPAIAEQIFAIANSAKAAAATSV